LAPRLSDRRLRLGFSWLLIASALLTGVEGWKRHTALQNLALQKTALHNNTQAALHHDRQP
jgi:hypothetical protein